MISNGTVFGPRALRQVDRTRRPRRRGADQPRRTRTRPQRRDARREELRQGHRSDPPHGRRGGEGAGSPPPSNPTGSIRTSTNGCAHCTGSWGITDDDHIVRPVITRGRATDAGHGNDARLPPVPGRADDSASTAPTGARSGRASRNGARDTDLLITRTVDPVAVPAAALQRLASGRPQGADAALGIR